MSDSADRKPWLLYGLLACSLALNVVMLAGRRPAKETPEAQAGAVEVADVPAEAPVVDAGDAEPAAEQAAPAVQQAGTEQVAGWSVLRGNVQGSLARTFQIEAGADGDALASVYARLFVWDLDMRRDVQAGDAVVVVWRKGPDGLPEIAAGSLKSGKLGRTIAAYRWQAPGDAFPSYWHLDGTEAPLRLRQGPISQYEQITSLLKDRPTHKGMDFKTPSGTEVTAPRAGTVLRANWNWNANGNCIEIRYDDGVIAKFLHLSENRVAVGQHVGAGQVIALSGNTGHTTAPHLHYQLERDGKILDPLDYHGADRRSLDAAQVAALRHDVAEFATAVETPPAR